MKGYCFFLLPIDYFGFVGKYLKPSGFLRNENRRNWNMGARNEVKGVEGLRAKNASGTKYRPRSASEEKMK